MNAPNSNRRPTFAADAMLGGLAQHLLLTGFDTKYDAAVIDNELRAIAREGRVVLTRDRELFECIDESVRYYPDSTDPDQQFRILVDHFDLSITKDRLFTRCTKCNVTLVDADPDRIASQVPPRTREWIDEYYKCPDCQSVYWRGSHHEDIVKKFSEWGLLGT